MKMEQKPLVSIIIPTYNRCQWLAEAIESCLAQTYRPVEIIVVDDGSKDLRAKEIASGYPAVKYFYQENRGLGAARNTGLRLCQGEFVQFLDDDDLLSEDSISKKISIFRQKFDVDIVYSDLELISGDGKQIARYYEERKRPLPEGDIYPDLLFNNFIPAHALLWRKSALQRAGGFPERSMLEDWECILRAAEHSRFAYIDEPLGCYRLHGENISLRFETQASAYAEVHKMILASDRFKQVPRSLRVRLICKYALKQFAEGDRALGKDFLRQAFSTSRRHPLPYLVLGFSLLGQRVNRSLIRSFWYLRAKTVRMPNSRDYFMKKAGVIQ